MSPTGSLSFLLIVLNVIFSYRGFTNEMFFDSYSFQVEKILVNKDYKRLISSGFLHVGWTHLIFNMLSLYIFSGSVEVILGPVGFLLIYFASLIGGNLLSLFIHRHHADYSAVGASGAVSGVMFASIALFPDMSVGIFFIPLAIPGWLYGLLFVLISIYGIRSRKDNIGHDAHLGGALIGMLVAIAMHPSSLVENLTAILAISLPAIFFIIMIITRPHFLLIDNYFFKKHHGNYTLDQRYNVQKRSQQQEIDRILEKIHRKGIRSLSKQEKEMLDEYSKRG